MFFKVLVALSALIVAYVSAETHTIVFDNRCGFGLPTLKINGPLIGARAYLQTGGCGVSGEGCTLIETTLCNSLSPGATTDISLIPPFSFTTTSGFGYFNGCDGFGADCTNANCPTAFHKPGDNFVQVTCENDDVSLAITFCD